MSLLLVAVGSWIHRKREGVDRPLLNSTALLVAGLLAVVFSLAMASNQARESEETVQEVEERARAGASNCESPISPKLGKFRFEEENEALSDVVADELPGFEGIFASAQAFDVTGPRGSFSAVLVLPFEGVGESENEADVLAETRELALERGGEPKDLDLLGVAAVSYTDQGRGAVAIVLDCHLVYVYAVDRRFATKLAQVVVDAQ